MKKSHIRNCGIQNGCAGNLCLLRAIRYAVCILAVAAACLLTGCAKEKDPMEKIKDLEFTVLAEENIPDELKSVIEEKKGNTFKVTYQDNGFLYICIGYGEQVSGGYSIVVNALYLTDNAVYADTTLLGPDPSDTGIKKNSPSYPYIVIKTEFVDKPVVFN
ncbi:MAG: protease complex subunit PrcB family protein [Lachnospiraceae bacterium]|nr:protease complex subunit PrcB family protein [Lachnospiraceae bacterium]MDE6964920.1 protease complex subunit PrcB family protein [Lachnospiraceae bacterium]